MHVWVCVYIFYVCTALFDKFKNFDLKKNVDMN